MVPVLLLPPFRVMICLFNKYILFSSHGTVQKFVQGKAENVLTFPLWFSRLIVGELYLTLLLN